MNNLPYEICQKILKRDNFTCQKCGFQDLEGDELKIRCKNTRSNREDEENLITLCSICYHYSPEDESEFRKYLDEKIDGKLLETFRKSRESVSERTKQGMLELFNKGKVVVRPPLGYKLVNNFLLQAENSYIIQEIYQTFLNSNLSLTKLAKKYNLSVNGLKKLLSNKTYLGKTKFAGTILQGSHTPLVSQELFDKVQEKLSHL